MMNTYLFWLYFDHQRQFRTPVTTDIISTSAGGTCDSLLDTIKYMNGQELFREDPDETVRMHRLILTLAIRMQ